ncbi:uncharacterized protein A4U43_C10F5170 [Asparagus officinalis]|uniref:Nucleolus and neural progenitor protein-like N-terminal domain-containing protein n=1 Tax=Asparagus officinalis TaxID=4686 RepID=A0A5P1E0U6_ASPOF|nr:uncharacterized protein LOC109825486 [Asparagus officinalis]ONK56201.1 uncharacterized protein A4U43_C10F5170 [Asparagus officinalis]
MESNSEIIGTNLDEKLKSLLSHLQTESGILDRLVYKNKNQHRRCPYFQALQKVRRDARLLNAAGLEEILSVLFPIIDGKKPAQRAFLPKKQKKNHPIAKHNYQERLLGIARLLSQMTEPILKAAIQISFLLAKSFFTGFSLTTLALLSRLRVLVQQILLDVVVVFNKVSSLSQQKHTVQLTQGFIETYREYYPSSGEVLILECVWKKDKFVLLERTNDNSTQNQQADLGALPLETSIKYETVPFFSEVISTEHEQDPVTQNCSPSMENFPIESQPATISSKDQPVTNSENRHAMDVEVFIQGASVCERVTSK